MDKHLHIVSFDVPYPPDYGGVIDVFYKIKALHEEGVKIHLHCFEYGRGKSAELNKYCEEVTYYKRINELPGFSKRLPYIVKSRASPKLLEKLLKDDHPILLEGIHCTYFLLSGELKNKNVFVRLHNVEHEYYHQLAKNERFFLRRLYFTTESKLLKRYERSIADKSKLIALSKKDAEVFREQFNTKTINYLPTFLPYNSVQSKTGKGNYCLYHGNLSVNENEKAAIFLAEEVFKHFQIPLVIAGKNSSKKLKKIVTEITNISLVENPTEEKMNDLISNAQINVLPVFNSAGIKIKLLNALFIGRFCITNKASVEGAELKKYCLIAETAEDFRGLISDFFHREFTQEEITIRQQLSHIYNNKKNAQQLMQWIW